MALDSRDKRASALACGLACLVGWPLADGVALNQGDRQQVAALYRGIASSVITLNAEHAIDAPDVDLYFRVDDVERYLDGPDADRYERGPV